jgi:hypothetical protein
MGEKRFGIAFARTPHGELVMRMVGNAKATTFETPQSCVAWLEDVVQHVRRNYYPKPTPAQPAK